MKNNYELTFGGISLTDYSCVYSGSKIFKKPEKEVLKYSIPGRNGDLSISQNKYSNVTIQYDCYIQSGFQENFERLINALSSIDGYGILDCSEEPDIYREALFTDEFSASTGAYNRRGKFTLSFDCKPQKWLKSGQISIDVTEGATLTNQQYFEAKPLFMVEGTGTLSVNGVTVQLSANTGTTYIDCDIADVYEGNTNRNGDVALTAYGFPTLVPGENTITNTGFTSVLMIPRWYKI